MVQLLQRQLSSSRRRRRRRCAAAACARPASTRCCSAAILGGFYGFMHYVHVSRTWCRFGRCSHSSLHATAAC